MSTLIRASISKKNPYYISKHRYYELKHFCLQYKEWKKAYAALLYSSGTSEVVRTIGSGFSDPIGEKATKLSEYSKNIDLVEQTAKEASEELYRYILMSVTEGRPFTYLEAKEDIPCGRDTFYDRYRRFFWILSNKKTF